MSVNLIGGFSSDNYVLISSTTPTAATSVNFTSISGYKKLLVLAINCGFATASYPLLRLNNDSTNDNYAHSAYSQQPNTGVDNLNARGRTSLLPFCQQTASTGWDFQAIIDNADTPNVKIATINGHFTNSGNSAIYRTLNSTGFYRASAAISQVNIVSSSANFSASGTIALYGVRS